MARMEIGTIVLAGALVVGLTLPGGKADADLQGGGGCAIGPNCPVVASQGGATSAQSLALAPAVSISFDASTNRYSVDGPWDCDSTDGDNEILARKPDALGRFRVLQRTADGGKLQRVKFTQFLGGSPVGMKVRDGDDVWSVRLVDGNRDGVMDAVRASSLGRPTALVDLVTVDADEDGTADYVTVPFALLPAGMVDADDGCADVQPMVPLTKNGALKFDLDGDGAKDPGTFKSVSFTR